MKEGFVKLTPEQVEQLKCNLDYENEILELKAQIAEKDAIIAEYEKRFFRIREVLNRE